MLTGDLGEDAADDGEQPDGDAEHQRQLMRLDAGGRLGSVGRVVVVVHDARQASR
jgi:hypothetical protein